MKIFVIFLVVCIASAYGTGRVTTVDKCIFAKALQKAGVPTAQLASWICYALQVSGLNYATIKPGCAGNRYGIFQIVSGNYCTVGSPGGACNADCNSFVNTNWVDDLNCAIKVMNITNMCEFQRGCSILPDLSSCSLS